MQPQKNDVNTGSISVLLWVLAISIFSIQRESFAQQFPTSSRPDPVNWVIGPATTTLGDYAEIKVPDGYRFVGAEEARTLLRQMNNPAPKALAGIMAPIYGKWMIVFEFADVGYVMDNGKEKIDSEAILTKLREKLLRQNERTQGGQGGGSFAQVEWEMEPKYTPQSHTLEWAIRAESGAGKAVNHVLRIFGKDGLLDGIAVQPSNVPADTIPLKELMSGISFKAGHTYADFRRGDKVSKRGLSDLITADETPEKKAGSLVWILALGGSVLALTGIGLVVVVVRKRTRDQKIVAKGHAPLEASVHTNGSSNGNGSSKPAFKRELPPLREDHVNGTVNGTVNGHQKMRRRKIFDYQKYYSDLLFQVSDRTYEMDAPKPDRNGSPIVRHAASEHMNQNSLAANQGLIESQKHLIEEQQRLIREQTKLIEEKTRLIQEKNQVLEKQSELFGNNVF
jgi:uncharacterized membrane-anchored protein